MNRTISLLALTITLCMASNAAAQLPSVAGFRGFRPLDQKPTVSPYLNLSRGTTQGISNYHSLVRPQLQARQRNTAQQRQLLRLQGQVSTMQTEGVRSQFGAMTGHPTRYSSYLHFYPGLPQRR